MLFSVYAGGGRTNRLASYELLLLNFFLSYIVYGIYSVVCLIEYELAGAAPPSVNLKTRP